MLVHKPLAVGRTEELFHLPACVSHLAAEGACLRRSGRTGRPIMHCKLI